MALLIVRDADGHVRSAYGGPTPPESFPTPPGHTAIEVHPSLITQVGVPFHPGSKLSRWLWDGNALQAVGDPRPVLVAEPNVVVVVEGAPEPTVVFHAEQPDGTHIFPTVVVPVELSNGLRMRVSLNNGVSPAVSIDTSKPGQVAINPAPDYAIGEGLRVRVLSTKIRV